MSKPFEWRDFSKRYNDLSSNNFPSLNKENNLENVLKVKFSSKAQKGVKLDSSVTNKDSKTTESDFGVKLNFEDIKGVEVGFKAKSKPGTEFSLKLDDSIVPLEGASFTLKSVTNAPSEQTIGGSFGFINKFLNLNFGVQLPIAKKFFEFLGEEKKLEEQRTKIDVDFVTRPLEDKDIYVGGEVKTQLPKGEAAPFLYTSKFSAALNNKTTNGGVFIQHDKTEEGKEQKTIQHATTFGGWAYTEVDDISGGAKVSYTPSKSSEAYKGFSFEVVTGLQRDADSKLSSKVTVIPTTTVSLGLEQKLNASTKLSFGYAFLLNKAIETAPSSTYSFGLEISH